MKKSLISFFVLCLTLLGSTSIYAEGLSMDSLKNKHVNTAVFTDSNTKDNSPKVNAPQACQRFGFWCRIDRDCCSGICAAVGDHKTECTN